MIRFKIHSVVDVITNSSTTIYTYQDGSINPAKELINEMLKLAGIDKKAEDIFYFGVFCDDYHYFEEVADEDLPESCPKVIGDYGTDEYKQLIKDQEEWFKNHKLSIMKGEAKKCEWMLNGEKDTSLYGWDPDSYLTLEPKEPQYKEFGNKIKSLLNSISADGGRD